MMMEGQKFERYGLSHKGQVRKTNEDQFLIAELSKSLLVDQTSLPYASRKLLFGGSHGQLLLVADGLGGHKAGERASTIAVDTVVNHVLNFMPWFFKLDQAHEDDLLEDLKHAVEKCGSRIQMEADAVPERKSMGTTLTMAYILWPRMYIVHIGDSRCYLFRESKLRQITKDHTIAQQLVEEGALEPDAAEDSQWSTVLWNVLGGGGSVEMNPEIHKSTLRPGDVVMLCSDGLTAHVDDSEITGVLGKNTHVEEVCHELVGMANEAGGTDNITVVVARYRQRAEDSTMAKQAEAERESQASASTAKI